MVDTVVGSAVELSPLDLLERRIEALEKQLEVTPGYEPKGPLTNELLEVHDKLAKEVVTPVAEATVLFNRLDEIGHLMSFEDQKEMVLSQAAKTELVLASEGSLTRLAKQMKEVEALEEYVNPKPLEDAAFFTPQLLPIATATQAVKEEYSEHANDVIALVSQYHSIMTSLSQKFAYWDEVLCKAEAEARKKGAAV
eukprot:m.442226 g.442226  ORF g.442226 m.442226 type:complete len:196 (-) comp18770_c0_seq1:219-806(-)